MLQALKERGFAGIRQDISTAESAEGLCREIAEAGMQAILLVAGGKMTRNGAAIAPDEVAGTAEHVARVANDLGLFDGDTPAAIEIGNEPDGAHATYLKSPATFARAIRLSFDRIRGVSAAAQVITGGITTTDRMRLDYLQSAVHAGIPDECIIGYHTYRTTVTPETAHPGFATRAAEFERLKHIAAGRRIWCTEGGWHTAPSTVKSGAFGLKKRRVQFTDEQVADFAARELRLNAEHGAEAFVWFQLNDGDNANAFEHRFGIRALNGSWKPVADRLTELAATL